jgi:hypothetical protein
METIFPLDFHISNSQEKIPRVIHYCWFGPKSIPRVVKRCVKSWKKFLPDYKIILWNEHNFDVNQHIYTQEAYAKKKYAFVTDYVRIYLLYTYGGIYLDSDVEIIKNIDEFLIHSAFSSFEHPDFIPTGLMASEKGNLWIKSLLNYYDSKHFIKEDDTLDMVSNTKIITQISVKDFGLIRNNEYQILKGDAHIFPKEYFCPWDWEKHCAVPTINSYAIHHFSGSWVSNSFRVRLFLKKQKTSIGLVVIRLLGTTLYNKIANSTFRKW